MNKNIFVLKNKFMFSFFVVAVLCVSGFYTASAQVGAAAGPVSTSQFTKLKYKVFQGSNGWGYDILNDSALLVHQPIIPGVMGNNGFASSAYAEKTAAFVINKIKHGVFPPTVTNHELDSLGVIKK